MSWALLIYLIINTIIFFLFDWILSTAKDNDKIDLQTEIILNALNSDKEAYLKVALAIIFFGLPLILIILIFKKKQ